LEEVQQSYPVNPLRDCCDPGKCTAFRALEKPRKAPCFWLARYFDWSMVGVGKMSVTKTRM